MEEERTLECSLTPERGSWAYRCGVFFDVLNKSDAPLEICAMTGGSIHKQQRSTLYACTEGESSGRECKRECWNAVWDGVLQIRTSTPMRLAEPVRIPPHARQGFLLVSDGYALYHTTSSKSVEDDNIMIIAGKRSTEHRGEKDPFSHEAHSSSEVSTHAGSVSYRLADVQVVMIEVSEPAADGSMVVLCNDCAGAQLCTFAAEAAWDVQRIRQLLGEQLGTPAHVFQLLGAGGQLLSDDETVQSIAASP